MPGQGSTRLGGLARVVRACQRVSAPANECPRLPMGVHACQWVSTSANECPRLPMSVHACQWVSTSANECPRLPMSVHVRQREAVNCHATDASAGSGLYIHDLRIAGAESLPSADAARSVALERLAMVDVDSRWRTWTRDGGRRLAMVDVASRWRTWTRVARRGLALPGVDSCRRA